MLSLLQLDEPADVGFVEARRQSWSDAMRYFALRLLVVEGARLLEMLMEVTGTSHSDCRGWQW